MTQSKKKSSVELGIRGFEECGDCVRKHLAAAMVVHGDEVFLGYPEHIDRVVGNLNEAAREALPHYIELALALREVRLRVMADAEDVPPYTHLLTWLRFSVVAKAAGTANPKPPDEVSAWLGAC